MVKLFVMASDWLRRACNPTRKLDRRINGVLPEAPPLHTLPLATKVPEPYRRWKDTPLRAIAMPMAAWDQKPARHHHQRPLCGRRGGLVVKIIERDLLPKYPNVDGVVG